MEGILTDENLRYVSDDDRAFLIAFDKEMQKLGYGRVEIGDFTRWGNYTVAYIKPEVKAKTYIAKVFFDGATVSLRLYFRNIDKHAKYIENAPEHIKDVFVNDEGRCHHCSPVGCVQPDCSCRHRKTYTIDGVTHEKCDGKVFYFRDFGVDKLSDYIGIVTQFYPTRK